MGNRKRVRARMSPLAFFVQACRAELRRRRPEVEVNSTVLSEACAERWRQTSPKERALFEHLSRVDKMRWERERGAPDGRGRPRKDRQKNTQESCVLGSMSQREDCPGQDAPFLSDTHNEIRAPQAVVGSPIGQRVGANFGSQRHLRPWPGKERMRVQTHKDKKSPKDFRREKRPGTPMGYQSQTARDPLQPRRPLSAFLLYSAEHKSQVRSEWPRLNYTEALKKLGEYWVELSPEQRRPFETHAAALRKQYGSDMAAYQVKNREFGVVSAKGEAPVSVGEEKEAVEHTQHSREPKNEDRREGTQTSMQLLSSEEIIDDLGVEEASYKGAIYSAN
ncbi:hypothetical protein NDU88_003307 [Pleurodeles waltl]|uniref:HMG box domain-containing protein n=1 Tax=Pleurodeles waltl TaxID=8319 RepID=A0AAV7P9N9_PLEWA|nr:hypothetical protein NDU88_003307 [Pleurodeles waltl]